MGLRSVLGNQDFEYEHVQKPSAWLSYGISSLKSWHETCTQATNNYEHNHLHQDFEIVKLKWWSAMWNL